MFEQVIEALFQMRPKKGQDLKSITEILDFWGNPHKNFPTVHIAGTNGKGQVAAKVAHALEKAGYKVGLYISPHLRTFEERISINQQLISKEKVLSYHEELTPFLKKIRNAPNFFDVVTAFGFRYFSENEVDIAVIEAGVGGRRDSTNVITPIVSIITSIGLDHAEYLGDTLESVASEKAGIIKPGVPLVLGPHARVGPIFKRVREAGSELFSVMRRSCFYDTENQAVAAQALKLIGQTFPMSREAIEAGLLYCLPCRFEKKGNVIYDVAHNPEGFTRLTDALDHLYPNRTFRFVIGMGSTKDHENSLSNIVPIAHHVHFVQAKNPDSTDPHTLAEIFSKVTDCPYTVHNSVTQGYCQAKESLGKDELLVVCGSFYIMGDTD